jgi:hypothetical protein
MFKFMEWQQKRECGASKLSTFPHAMGLRRAAGECRSSVSRS